MVHVLNYNKTHFDRHKIHHAKYLPRKSRLFGGGWSVPGTMTFDDRDSHLATP